MNNHLPHGAIHVQELKLWAHVGVLEKERLFGQYFLLDFTLWIDLDKVSKSDKLSDTADYSKAINDLHNLAFELNCQTIEFFSEKILDLLEENYGPIPMLVFLRKCNVPIEGFQGIVGIERSRYLKSS